MQCADVGVVQGRNRASLALEAAARVGVAGKMGGQDFDGDGSVKARVAGTVHLAHATCAERRLNFVGAKSGARGQSHGSAAIIVRSVRYKGIRRFWVDSRQAFSYEIWEELPVTRLTCASWNFFYSNSYFLQMAFGYDGLCQRRVRGTEVSAHKSQQKDFCVGTILTRS